MACPNNPLAVLVCVDDRQELRCKLPILLLDGKVLLMIPHDGDENLIGQVEERRVEVSLKDRRILVQVRHESAQVHILVDTVAPLLRESFQLFPDFFLAPHRTDDDAIRMELCFVIEKVADANGR